MLSPKVARAGRTNSFGHVGLDLDEVHGSPLARVSELSESPVCCHEQDSGVMSLGRITSEIGLERTSLLHSLVAQGMVVEHWKTCSGELSVVGFHAGTKYTHGPASLDVSVVVMFFLRLLLVFGST